MTYNTGSIGEFMKWTKQVARDPAAATATPRRWYNDDAMAGKAFRTATSPKAPLTQTAKEKRDSGIPGLPRRQFHKAGGTFVFEKGSTMRLGRTQDARMERRLTAILAADVVGYSRLMGEDEVGTLARLKTCRRELVDPAIEEFHGRIVKLMGDGALVEFASVVDAVQCAAAIQRRMAGHDQGVPEAQRIRFRLGVNLGDVIVDGNDIYGDGVNVAARLEGLADPGGICISGTAFDHAVNKADVGFASLGEQRLKNIADPVRVYRVLLNPGKPGKIAGRSYWPGTRT